MSALAITPGTVTPVAIYGQSTGAIGATTATGGTGPYSAAWTVTNGGTPISATTLTAKTGLRAGTYAIVVTDAASATASHTYTVTQNAQLTISLAPKTNIVVNGAATGALGAITATGGSGPYSAAWTVTGGGTPISATTLTAKTGLRAGTYAVVVTDAAGATATQTVTLTQPDPLEISGGEVSKEFRDGEWRRAIAEVTLSGGTGPYTYAWTSTGTSVPHDLDEKTGLAPGEYTITVTDAASATVSRTIVVDVKYQRRMWRTATGWTAVKPKR